MTSARAFVLRHTRLRPVPGMTGIRLHLADDVLPLWRAVQVETGDHDADLPYWAFAWAGGLAIAQHLRARPELVAGRRVVDVGSGSGLCAIAAVQAGASAVDAIDIDTFAAAAIELNARANGARISVVHRDVLADDVADADVILAGDCWYEARFASRVLDWLRRARSNGVQVLLGDPGRRYLPADELVELGRYEVATTTELEDLGQKQARVFTIAPSDATAQPAAALGSDRRPRRPNSRASRPNAVDHSTRVTRPKRR